MRSIRKRHTRGARLGQHFLTGTWAARLLAEAVDVRPHETILEIGPGKGALTKELLATGAHVTAIEKDPDFVVRLRKSNMEQTRLTLVEADIRDITPEKLGLKHYVVAANIPYYITGEIIRQFLEAIVQPRAMALLVQKEVAGRIVARDSKESILSLSVKAYGNPKIVARVSRGNFSPPPSVDSAILLIADISKKFFRDVGEVTFFRVVKAGFASKRKFLANNLSVRFGKDTVIAAFNQCGVGPSIRAEDVRLEVWKNLTQFIEKTPSS